MAFNPNLFCATLIIFIPKKYNHFMKIRWNTSVTIDATISLNLTKPKLQLNLRNIARQSDNDSAIRNQKSKRQVVAIPMLPTMYRKRPITSNMQEQKIFI